MRIKKMFKSTNNNNKLSLMLYNMKVFLTAAD